MTTRREASAAQAASDLDAYDILASSTLPSSHRLHYLQMWLEKLCKAYLWLPEAAADDLRSKHNVVDKVLPRIIQEHWRRIGFTHRPDIASIRQLCREVDLLHPQVDDNGRRPDNVEYPWTGVSWRCRGAGSVGVFARAKAVYECWEIAPQGGGQPDSQPGGLC